MDTRGEGTNSEFGYFMYTELSTISVYFILNGIRAHFVMSIIRRLNLTIYPANSEA